MVQRGLKNEDGYTVVELLVALTIVSIIMGIAGSTFVFISRQMNRWSTNLEFYNNFHVAETKIYNDMIRSESFIQTDSSVTITKPNKDIIEYRWKDEILTVNGNRLSDPAIDSLTFEMSGTTGQVQVVEWSLHQKEGNRAISSQFVLHSRKPSLWTPMRSNKKGDS
ncbi:MAG: prepilin-type N-terminal cleavage/methylation domain-containing protein [Balneolaceae bacterium]